jgi:PAS domain S-box-containing protein
MARTTPTGVERTFGEEEIIVSKTDLFGRITYANDVFCRVAGYSEEELLGQPHSLIRHPDMPRCVFKLLWDTLQAKREIFAYVVNMARNGDHYWVFAHVTPSFDHEGKVVGYHSSRRCPDRDAVKAMIPLYQALKREEEKHREKQQGIAASTSALLQTLAENKVSYPEFVFSLSQ